MVHVVILLINNIIGLVSTLQFTIRPYKSWDYVHEFYGEISQFVEAQKSPGDNLQSVVALYAAPLYSLIFFIFFGLGEEAITEYIAIYQRCLTILERIGLRAKTRWVHASYRLHVDSLLMFSPSPTVGPALPNLGSKAVSATGRPLRPDSFRPDRSYDDKDHLMFEGISPRDGAMGIPILVERSVV